MTITPGWTLFFAACAIAIVIAVLQIAFGIFS